MSEYTVDTYLDSIDVADAPPTPNLRAKCLAKWGEVYAPEHWLRIRIRQTAQDLAHDGGVPEAAAANLVYSLGYNWPGAARDWQGTYARVLMGIERRLDRR